MHCLYQSPLWAFVVQSTLTSFNFHFLFPNSNDLHFQFFIFDKDCHMPPWRNRLARSAVNRKVGGSSPPGGAHFLVSAFSRNSYLTKKILTLAGFEPAIPWFVVRCLIRWATGPLLLHIDSTAETKVKASFVSKRQSPAHTQQRRPLSQMNSTTTFTEPSEILGLLGNLSFTF